VPALAELRAIPFVAKPFENGELVNVVETLATRQTGRASRTFVFLP
jgi:hypothetical protein